jgi:hypothetical protein
VPLLLPLAVPFFAIVAALVLAGLSKSATAQHGSSNSGTFWDTITGRTYLRSLSGFAAGFARWIVSHFAASQLRLLTRWFMAMGTLTIGWFSAEAQFTEEIVAAVEWVEHHGDPKARAKAQTANRHAIKAGHEATHANTHARSVGHALDRHKARVNPILRHHTHAIDVTLPRDIGRVRTREGELSRDLGKLRDRTKAIEDGALGTFRWIRAHPFSAATGVFAGAVAIALSRLGLGNLRCKNFRNLLNNWGCGLGSALGDLLGLVAAVLAVSDLERLAKEMQAVEHLATEGIAELVGLADVFKKL